MPRLGDIVMPRIEPKIGQVVEPQIGEIAVPQIGEIVVPKIEPKIEIPPQNIPDYKPPPEETRPKLPGLPLPISSGTRDIPVYNPARLFGRKEWIVEWFGPGAYFPAKSKSRKSRRGGRKK